MTKPSKPKTKEITFDSHLKTTLLANGTNQNQLCFPGVRFLAIKATLIGSFNWAAFAVKS